MVALAQEWQKDLEQKANDVAWVGVQYFDPQQERPNHVLYTFTVNSIEMAADAVRKNTDLPGSIRELLLNKLASVMNNEVPIERTAS